MQSCDHRQWRKQHTWNGSKWKLTHHAYELIKVARGVNLCRYARFFKL